MKIVRIMCPSGIHSCLDIYLEVLSINLSKYSGKNDCQLLHQFLPLSDNGCTVEYRKITKRFINKWLILKLVLLLISSSIPDSHNTVMENQLLYNSYNASPNSSASQGMGGITQ